MWIEAAAGLLIALITALVGYWIGSMRFFKEHQLRVYGEVLPVILKYAFDLGDRNDEVEFNKALSKVWLYASKEVAIQLDKAVSCTVDPRRGDFKSELQAAIVAMRKDVLPKWYWVDRSLKKDEVKHYYFRF